MIRQQLTDNQKRKFMHRSVCPICGNKIEDYDDFQLVSYPFGRLVWYSFFHTNCLIKHEAESRKAM